LKPDVGSPLTEVSERPTASAHLDSDLAGKEGARRCSYLVRMIKPNSITSHDWHVQPICQRSLRAVRLSGAPWIEAQAFAGVSSNLLRWPTAASYFCFESCYRLFCANLLKLPEIDFQVNDDVSPGCLVYNEDDLTGKTQRIAGKIHQIAQVRAAQNIKDRPDK